MYSTILFLHSTTRWFVLFSLFYAIYRAYKGFITKSKFTQFDNRIRHWTATFAHVQLVLGIFVYIKSPMIKYYFTTIKASITNWDFTFFGLFHFAIMLVAILTITIGSAKSKRNTVHTEKFKTILLYYSIALILIFIAIPWPFSPMAVRPYFRPF